MSAVLKLATSGTEGILLVFPVLKGGANTTLLRAMLGTPLATGWGKGSHELVIQGPVNGVKGIRWNARRRHEVMWRSPVSLYGREGDEFIESGARRRGKLVALVA
jgi:hypothetical protein